MSKGKGDMPEKFEVISRLAVNSNPHGSFSYQRATWNLCLYYGSVLLVCYNCKKICGQWGGRHNRSKGWRGREFCHVSSSSSSSGTHTHSLPSFFLLSPRLSFYYIILYFSFSHSLTSQCSSLSRFPFSLALSLRLSLSPSSELCQCE